MSRSPRSWSARAVACALVLLGSAAHGTETPPAAPRAEGTPARPTQAAFRDWPPDALLERPYWLPWSWSAFQRAALFSRPVFFVMQADWSRQSQRFVSETVQDPAVLRLLNNGWVMVQVNADLRPDIRERYQTGSWPVVAFLMPDGNPMLSQVGEMEVAKPITTGAVATDVLQFLLREGIEYWDLRGPELFEEGRKWVAEEGPPEPLWGVVDSVASDAVARWLVANADRRDGGFGLAPKFVLPGLAEYASLRASRGAGDVAAHARFTLERLVASPLYDAGDGGVHRLAAAPGFGSIQYEKLLEANAALLRELVWTLRGADAPELRDALQSSARWIVRTLGDDGGGFALAQVADPASEDGGAWWRAAQAAPAQAPPLDPPVLAGPNALAGAALVRAGLLLDDPSLVEAGRRALERVLGEGYRRGRGVVHVLEPFDDSRVYLTTQADAAQGFLDAYETTGEARWLAAARDIADFALANLSDPDEATLRDHLPDRLSMGLLRNARRPLRPNVRMVRVLLRLSLLGEGAAYRERAREMLATHTGDLTVYGVHAVEAALAVEESLAEPLVVRVAGPPAEARTRALRAAALALPWPYTLVAAGDPTAAPAAELRRGSSVRQVQEPAALVAAARALTAEAR